MQKEEKTRHYIEVFYNYNPDRGTQDDFTHLHSIDDRNPLLYIDKYNVAIGFRFFDVDIFDNPWDKEKRKNISPIYYYGRYMTEQEIKQVHKSMPYTINNKKMIQCFCGCVVPNLNEGDIPLEEYTNLLNNGKSNSEIKQLLKRV